jgi:hypothetical protein
MYKLISYDNRIICVNKTEGDIIKSIPFDPANTDYANFKKDVLAGAELQDADGKTMTANKAKEFVATLP